MKILFASPDRDMLLCYSRLLEQEGFLVQSTFDGTELFRLFAEGGWGLIVLDLRLPRLDAPRFLRLAREENVPLLALNERRIRSAELGSEVLASSYLAYPFLPGEFLGRMKNLLARAAQPPLTEQDVAIDPARLLIEDRLPLTNEELSVWEGALKGVKAPVKHPGVYVASLNAKLARSGKSARLQYILGEGYRVVTRNE